MSQQQYQAEVMDELRMQEDVQKLYESISSMSDDEFFNLLNKIDEVKSERA